MRRQFEIEAQETENSQGSLSRVGEALDRMLEAARSHWKGYMGIAGVICCVLNILAFANSIGYSTVCNIRAFGH
mgnify:CR=1 FL=1